MESSNTFQEFLRTLQRHYSNAYMDGEKQDSINSQLGKPALWELDSDQHYNVGRLGSDLAGENSRLLMKRSLSDGNILCKSNSPIEDANTEQNQHSDQSLLDRTQSANEGLSGSTPEISTCESNISYSRQSNLENDGMYYHDRWDSFDCSNFIDADWISSSGNSIEEETYER
ncbi:hypothetical protein ACH5RR_024295 [Cinchona calisaya]|uniref:Uncharacterized protein n=1 Tax=Cinchona calisaya TaxID=153742 RepID=A0ABD2Z1A9_9GENT